MFCMYPYIFQADKLSLEYDNAVYREEFYQLGKYRDTYKTYRNLF